MAYSKKSPLWVAVLLVLGILIIPGCAAGFRQTAGEAVMIVDRGVDRSFDGDQTHWLTVGRWDEAGVYEQFRITVPAIVYVQLRDRSEACLRQSLGRYEIVQCF